MELCFTSTIRRYYELEVPSAAPDGRPWPLLIALHGYQGDKDSMMEVARDIADGRMVVISLQGHNQFFSVRDANDPTKSRRVVFGWGTHYKMEESVRIHHQAVRRLIRLAVRKHHADASRVFLLAFSQACAYNYRYAFTYPDQIWGVIGVCGGVPADWDTSPLYKPAGPHVLHIAATDDEWYSQERNLDHQRKLAQRAASLDFRFYNSKHRFPRSSIPDIQKWIEKIADLRLSITD
jgi:predicted esterase